MVFAVSALSSGYSGKQALGALRTVTGSYMKLQEMDTNLVEAIGECKLCGNLILLVQDEELGTQIAQAIPGYVQSIDIIFASMEEMCAQVGSAEM